MWFSNISIFLVIFVIVHVVTSSHRHRYHCRNCKHYHHKHYYFGRHHRTTLKNNQISTTTVPTSTAETVTFKPLHHPLFPLKMPATTLSDLTNYSQKPRRIIPSAANREVDSREPVTIYAPGGNRKYFLSKTSIHEVPVVADPHTNSTVPILSITEMAKTPMDKVDASTLITVGNSRVPAINSPEGSKTLLSQVSTSTAIIKTKLSMTATTTNTATSSNKAPATVVPVVTNTPSDYGETFPLYPTIMPNTARQTAVILQGKPFQPVKSTISTTPADAVDGVPLHYEDLFPIFPSKIPSIRISDTSNPPIPNKTLIDGTPKVTNANPNNQKDLVPSPLNKAFREPTLSNGNVSVHSKQPTLSESEENVPFPVVQSQ